MWGKNLMEALGADPSFLSGSIQYATASLNIRLGSLPSREDYIRENLRSSMRLQSGNKRIRKKRAKASLRIQWKLLLAFSRIASRRINYSEIGRRLLAVQPLPQGAEPIYYKDPDFWGKLEILD